ncbi:hypothetical protein SAMN05216228_102833 [Rhizobium tibeticum]|uniref:Uncharacterized protein n=1 Tax=Rhizobium tibeticum TaxID=501024 RepID=A0A1H8TDF0_9HYPH|nr:hypothetical protein [Rhizobium tibeticum]SEI14748.1 hypothetical protein RTCCBAU85039_5134 [Rhizobium tibeticum]SEO88538.1 hypothetical protein SAMN05216228_102833 [Rhizobium tibeticum]
MTYDLEIHIEELRAEANHCDLTERAQIIAELEAARAALAAAIAAQDVERVGEPPH